MSLPYLFIIQVAGIVYFSSSISGVKIEGEEVGGETKYEI